MKALLKEKSEKIVSIILFGSMAKGNYTIYSDYDLLLIVSYESLDFKNRLYEYSKFSNGWVEIFPYTMDEANFMFKNFNPLILDALKDGIIIYDKGFWKKLKKEFKKLIKQKTLISKENGWIVNYFSTKV